jgi:hypothetical protein
MDPPKYCKPSPATLKAWGTPAASAPRWVLRIKHLLLRPRAGWGAIARESTPVAKLYAGFVLPLALPAALLGLRMPKSTALTFLMLFVCALLGVFVTGLIINLLAPAFSGRKDLRQAIKVAAYSLMPASLSSVLVLAPPLWATPLQALAGLYSIYLLSLGLPVLMQSPRHKAFGYSASVLACIVLAGVVFAFLSIYGAAQPK